MMMRHGSTVLDAAFESLKRAPWQLLAGEFVRAEARTCSALSAGAAGVAAAERRPLRKTDVLLDGTVLKIFANRKAHWQK